MWVCEVQVVVTAKCEVQVVVRAKCEVRVPLQTKHLLIPNIDEFNTGVSKISNFRPSR